MPDNLWPKALYLLVALVAIWGLGFALWRKGVERNAISRTWIVVVPTDQSDPAPEAVKAFAAAMSGARTWNRPISWQGVRVQLRSAPGGRCLYLVQVPGNSEGRMRSALASYGVSALTPEAASRLPNVPDLTDLLTVPAVSGSQAPWRPARLLPTLWRRLRTAVASRSSRSSS